VDVRSLLRRPALVGLLVHHGEIVGEAPDLPAIMPRDLWDRVQARMQVMAALPGKGRGRESKARNLLTRETPLVSPCGKPYVTKWHRNDTAYICGHANRGTTCDAPRFSRKDIDAPLLRMLLDRYVDVEATRKALIESAGSELDAIQAEIEQARKSRKTAEARLRRVRQAFQDGDLPVHDWNEQRDELTAELEAAQERVAQLEQDAEGVRASSAETDPGDQLRTLLAGIHAAVELEDVDALTLPTIRLVRATIQRLFERVDVEVLDGKTLIFPVLRATAIEWIEGVGHAKRTPLPKSDLTSQKTSRRPRRTTRSSS
jgi:hypothetical protein